jgi:two-component system response regulator MprA
MMRFGEAGPQQGLRVLLLDHDSQFTEFLRLGFEYEGCEVFVARTTSGHITPPTQPTCHQPAGISAVILDAIIIGAALPSDSTLGHIRSLRADTDDAAIVLLSARDSVDERIAVLEAGADDVMTTPIAFKELMARLRAVLRRRNHTITGTALTFADVTLDRATHLVKRQGRSIALTPREFDLLEFFLRHPRQVLTREMILARVWGITYCDDDNVLEVYIHTLRAKLGDLPPRLIQTVRGAGYVLRGQRDQRDSRPIPASNTPHFTRGIPPGTDQVSRPPERDALRDHRHDSGASAYTSQ